MKYRRLLDPTSAGGKVEETKVEETKVVDKVVDKVSDKEIKQAVIPEVPKEVPKETSDMSEFEKKFNERLAKLEKENYELKRGQIMQGIDNNVLKLAKEKGVDLSGLDNKALGTMAQMLGLVPTKDVKKVTHSQVVDTGIKESEDFMTIWEKKRGRTK